MTSNDQFITLDVFNARMDRLEAINEKNFALMQKENAEFREQIKSDISTFRDDMQKEFYNIHSEISVLQKDVEGVKHDVIGLYHWDYWLLSIILVFFATPQIFAGIKSLFTVFTDGIAGIIAVFRQKQSKKRVKKFALLGVRSVKYINKKIINNEVILAQ